MVIYYVILQASKAMIVFFYAAVFDDNITYMLRLFKIPQLNKASRYNIGFLTDTNKQISKNEANKNINIFSYLPHNN